MHLIGLFQYLTPDSALTPSSVADARCGSSPRSQVQVPATLPVTRFTCVDALTKTVDPAWKSVIGQMISNSDEF